MQYLNICTHSVYCVTGIISKLISLPTDYRKGLKGYAFVSDNLFTVVNAIALKKYCFEHYKLKEKSWLKLNFTWKNFIRRHFLIMIHVEI